MSLTEVDVTEQLLLVQEAAKVLRISVGTLAKYRCYGTGPTYRKYGGRVVYALSDLHAWSLRGERRSTSDEQAEVVPPPRPPVDRPVKDGERGDER